MDSLTGKIKVSSIGGDYSNADKHLTYSGYNSASSARNFSRGGIVEISNLGSAVRLKVDVGKPFIIQITKRSFNEMGLTRTWKFT